MKPSDIKDRQRKDGWVILGHRKIDALPTIRTPSLVSAPVLFIAEGKLYAGEYHQDGWFYAHWPPGSRRMIRGSVAAFDPYPSPNVWCEAWRYMNVD